MFFRERRRQAAFKQRKLQRLTEERAREREGREARQGRDAVEYNLAALSGQLPTEFNSGGFLEESIGGNAGEGHWGLNIWLDQRGAIVGFGCIQHVRPNQRRHTNLCLRIPMDGRRIDFEGSDVDAASATQHRVIADTVRRFNGLGLSVAVG